MRNKTLVQDGAMTLMLETATGNGLREAFTSVRREKGGKSRHSRNKSNNILMVGMSKFHAWCEWMGR